jgi:hypothetical protein
MPFETMNLEEITEARRKAIAASIRTLNLEELKALGEKLFPLPATRGGKRSSTS